MSTGTMRRNQVLVLSGSMVARGAWNDEVAVRGESGSSSGTRFGRGGVRFEVVDGTRSGYPPLMTPPAEILEGQYPRSCDAFEPAIQCQRAQPPTCGGPTDAPARCLDAKRRISPLGR